QALQNHNPLERESAADYKAERRACESIVCFFRSQGHLCPSKHSRVPFRAVSAHV
ncbi:unnamed protein product, partial [Ectocarpus sp. 6 AP-2014]